MNGGKKRTSELIKTDNLLILEYIFDKNKFFKFIKILIVCLFICPSLFVCFSLLVFLPVFVYLLVVCLPLFIICLFVCLPFIACLLTFSCKLLYEEIKILFRTIITFFYAKKKIKRVRI